MEFFDDFFVVNDINIHQLKLGSFKILSFWMKLYSNIVISNMF